MLGMKDERELGLILFSLFQEYSLSEILEPLQIITFCVRAWSIAHFLASYVAKKLFLWISESQ